MFTLEQIKAYIEYRIALRKGKAPKKKSDSALLISDMRHRAQYARENGRAEIAVTPEEYEKLLNRAELFTEHLRYAGGDIAYVFGCRLIVREKQ